MKDLTKPERTAQEEPGRQAPVKAMEGRFHARVPGEVRSGVPAIRAAPR